MNREIKFIDLGQMDYKDAWDYQQNLFDEIIEIKKKNRQNNTNNATPNYFIFVEHPHVYTLGKSGNISNLLIDENQLKNKNASFYKINRGGDITYHGPGQIVCYPILDLENFFTDIHKYLRFLEETVILALENYGIKGERNNGKTGVWMDVDTPFPRKICAMGVRASRWVTMHGFALNVNVDLDYFNNIVPCGLTNNIVTSIYNERKDYDLAINDVKSDLKECFSKTFNSTFI
ncbi:MAG: lipoyl(octanoyl) transferase LipB [Flavobacteriaceae bacterium]|jgi:lipoyl(octanoyl) transferase|nr:MAG: lipoyl(octanoyl) transferase LipB [Bacteroidota bacterium]|tara:strand:+ start:1653 stop:2351 length:699 start_codon:yes stop_codon:yes gene_type:complete